ncbi:TlyA family rRNA (cytidine-2'-O)-methyltransferase [Candidatus Poribacteria bacterium]|nr:TlyA family rRNA (cytidine-2'-O)-methyltransferase [Candidatus Poribacteria bacterium]
MPRQSERLDILLVQRGEVPSRGRAKRLIMAGDVSVDGQIVDKPGKQVSIDAQITLQKPDIPYVSRGGLKLEKALIFFKIDVTGKNCIDVGASTGGFTDCLLQNGAAMVYAVDVGYGQIDWKLRNDKRVILFERTNIRYVKPDQFEEELELATIDVSFISLKSVLPVVNSLLKSQGQIIALIKPQFEAGRGNVGKGGVVREGEIHRDVIEGIWSLALDMDLIVSGLTYSPLKGPAGNIEYLIWLQKGICEKSIDPENTINSVVQESHTQL